jgi:hypothetical protein
MHLHPPDDHFAASPDGGVVISACRRIDGAGACPTISGGIVSTTAVQLGARETATPDDHFGASPYCCVTVSFLRSIEGASCGPAIGKNARIVPVAIEHAPAQTSKITKVRRLRKAA